MTSITGLPKDPDLLIVDRWCWRAVLLPDGSMSRTYFFTQEKLPRDKVRKMDRVIGPLLDTIQQRARDLRKDLPGISKEAQDQ